MYFIASYKPRKVHDKISHQKSIQIDEKKSNEKIRPSNNWIDPYSVLHFGGKNCLKIGVGLQEGSKVTGSYNFKGSKIVFLDQIYKSDFNFLVPTQLIKLSYS